MSELFQKKMEELMKLEKEQLAERLAYFETIWEHIDSETKWWLQKIYSFVRGIRRDYQPIFGVLVGLKFEVAEMDIWVETKYRDYTENVDVQERKVVRIKPSSLIQIDFVEEQIRLDEVHPQQT
ncbi:MAG: hypothetical protein ACXQS5_06690 [Candidatus Methanospirareceae archaeon]